MIIIRSAGSANVFECKSRHVEGARRPGNLALPHLGKRSMPKDLTDLFDKFMNPHDTPAHGVA
jgi:hypothetical protein